MANQECKVSNGIVDQLGQSWEGFWQGRSMQERKLLSMGALAIVLALVYLILLAPALSGRAQLEKSLPMLHQQAADLQALSQEAQTLANQAPSTIVPMSKESLEASLTQRGLTAQGVALTSDFAKVQLSGVPFASVIGWLDELQKLNRISVLEASIVAQPVAGMVNVTLALKQQKSDQ
jgi:general secretion pathway protein M